MGGRSRAAGEIPAARLLVFGVEVYRSWDVIFSAIPGMILSISVKSLYHRVRQYFHTSDHSNSKYNDLVREIRQIEIIKTDTETNALILECQLIKKNQPRYNSQLKRKKIYPYLKINPDLDYPTIAIADETANDGKEYFGSFYSKEDAVSAIELINSIWNTPLCSKESFADADRPCLNYHLKLCCAPCGRKIERAIYQNRVSEIIKCLNGNYTGTIRRLKREMNMAADHYKFEKAARFRDNLAGLEILKKRQKRLYTTLEGKDVYMFFRALREERFTLFFIRNGETCSRMDFPDIKEFDKERLTLFIEDNRKNIMSIEDGTFLTSCLLEIGASKLFVPVPRKAGASSIMRKLEKMYREFIE